VEERSLLSRKSRVDVEHTKYLTACEGRAEVSVRLRTSLLPVRQPWLPQCISTLGGLDFTSFTLTYSVESRPPNYSQLTPHQVAATFSRLTSFNFPKGVRGGKVLQVRFELSQLTCIFPHTGLARTGIQFQYLGSWESAAACAEYFVSIVSIDRHSTYVFPSLCCQFAIEMLFH